jgi:DNA polymerase III subunit epsilon
MIYQRLNLTRNLFVFDTETTGTDRKEDRIIEFGFQLFTSEGLVREWRSLINPGMPIPLASSKVHGIYDLDMQRCRECKLIVDDVAPDRCQCTQSKRPPYFRQIATNLAQGFSNCDYAGKNIRFDLQILDAEFSRLGIPWSYKDARIIDADRLEQICEPRNLSTLYKKYTGKDMEDAHEALADVRATTEILVCQLEKYPDLFPSDLDALHQLQWPDWIDVEGKFKFINGVPCIGRWGKHANKPMHSVPTSYWDFMLTGDFSFEVKEIARKAKLRQFPEAPSEPERKTVSSSDESAHLDGDAGEAGSEI